jgi:cell wall-associated NlpC family hydrolase
MNEPSYFDDPEKAELLYHEASSWIGTPFAEYYPDQIEKRQKEHPEMLFIIKGFGGGIDCIGLVEQVFARIGATDKFFFKREPADYQSHQLGDKVLDWMRGKVDDPQSKQLAEILQELEIPPAVIDPEAKTPRDFFKPGDICVMQHGGLFHLPLIYDDDLHFVNALPRIGVIQGTIQDSSYGKHLVAVFRLKPK